MLRVWIVCCDGIEWCEWSNVESCCQSHCPVIGLLFNPLLYLFCSFRLLSCNLAILLHAVMWLICYGVQWLVCRYSMPWIPRFKALRPPSLNSLRYPHTTTCHRRFPPLPTSLAPSLCKLCKPIMPTKPAGLINATRPTKLAVLNKPAKATKSGRIAKLVSLTRPAWLSRHQRPIVTQPVITSDKPR